MITKTIQRLQELLSIIPEKIKQISDEDFNKKPSLEKWSKKEILGHLIDSAANNHQRIIRTQYENIPKIIYQQNYWVLLNKYEKMNRENVLAFWVVFNQHILEIIQQIPTENLNLTCDTGLENPVKLSWLIDDYVVHLEHHLKQITDY